MIKIIDKDIAEYNSVPPFSYEHECLIYDILNYIFGTRKETDRGNYSLSGRNVMFVRNKKEGYDSIHINGFVTPTELDKICSRYGYKEVKVGVSDLKFDCHHNWKGVVEVSVRMVA
jgi:hypothetical protein